MSLQNPLHPGTILTALKLIAERLISVQIVLPPNSQVVFSIAPQADTIWILGINSIGVFRDFLTGNPINTSLVSIKTEHPMVRSILASALDSTVKSPWGTTIDISTGWPMINTVTNNTGLFISLDFTQGIYECSQRIYNETYLKMWNGLRNMMEFMGEYTGEEIVLLAKALKDLVLSSPKSGKETEK